MKNVSQNSLKCICQVWDWCQGAGRTNKSGMQFLTSSSLPVRIDEAATETNAVSAPLTSPGGAGGGPSWKEGRTAGEGSEVRVVSDVWVGEKEFRAREG